MNSIAPASSARPTITRADPIDRAPEPNDDAPETTSRRTSKQAEFSALLALLAGTGARVRNDILKQLPAEGASLVDRLLAEAGAGATEEVGAGEAEPTANSDMGGLVLGRDRPEAAADAMRYGQLLRNEMGLQTPGNDRERNMPATSNEDLTRTGANKGTNGLPGLSRALQHSQAADTLSRIVSRRGASVEQLLALGDEKGADARAALDGILSQAGTATGEQLAAFSNDSTTPPAAAVAAAALAAANATSRAHVDTPVRDADALVPEFRTRIDRVIARMKQEYGHEVTLVETARSQERQDALFEQGRSRPGNIVTWTRDSAHTRGEAADMLVDGTYNNAEGFARLQRIAREEGLRTLGVKDPGHLELPRSARQADAMLGGAARVSARIERVNMQSSSAASPAVAPVAGVASVAGVARVADSAPPTTANANSQASMYSALGGAAGKGDTGNASNGNTFGKGERDENGAPLDSGRKLGQRRVASDDSTPGHAFGQVAGPASANGTAKAEGTAPVAGADSAQRVADLQDRRDATPGSVSRLTLSVEGANGDSDRITIDLRGKSVGTHIDTNASNADALRSRSGELQEALGRHGLEGDTVRISSSARTEGAEGARSVGAERDALKLAAAQQGSANDGAAGNGQQRSTSARDWDKQDDARRARDEQRDAKHDARHDAKQDAKRDGRERGQQRFFNEGQR